MSSLFFLFLFILLFTAAFFIYLVRNLKGTQSVKADVSYASGSNGKDLQEMAELLEGGSSKSAKLVIDQLANRDVRGKNAADIWALRMLAYVKLGEYHNALHSALQLNKVGNRSRFIGETELIEYLAEIYSNLGHHEKAYNEYALLITQEQNTPSIEHIYGAGAQALEMKQYETSITLFTKILRMDPDHTLTLCKIGRCYFEKKYYPEALDYLNRAYLQNYDCNELRYYLALSLLQVGGKDTTALGLLQRVSEDLDWSKKVLPILVKLAAKLKSHSQVIEACERYYRLHGDESSKSMLDELAMSEASAYRYLGKFAEACDLWGKIDKSSSYSAEAEFLRSSLRPFLVVDSIFYDYLNGSPSVLSDLCSTACENILKQEEPKAEFVFEARNLRPATDGPVKPKDASLGIIIQQRINRWNPNTGRPERFPPDFHIFLRLDHDFSDADLKFNLDEFAIEKENSSRVMQVHLYALHEVTQMGFGFSERYALSFHEPEKLRLALDDMEKQRLAALPDSGNSDTKGVAQLASISAAI